MDKIKVNIILILILNLVFIIQCSDPLSDDKAIVKTLVHGPISYGQYVIFWNGTDDKNKTVEGGTYYVRLYSREMTDQKKITVLDGGTDTINDSTDYTPSMPLLTQIVGIRPNPFYGREGTNIILDISIQDDRKTFQLTIRDKE
jgi:hypothetical protein